MGTPKWRNHLFVCDNSFSEFPIGIRIPPDPELTPSAPINRSSNCSVFRYRANFSDACWYSAEQSFGVIWKFARRVDRCFPYTFWL